MDTDVENATNPLVLKKKTDAHCITTHLLVAPKGSMGSRKLMSPTPMLLIAWICSVVVFQQMVGGLSLYLFEPLGIILLELGLSSPPPPIPVLSERHILRPIASHNFG